MRLVWDEGHARGRLRWRSAERRLPAGVEVVSYRSAGSSLERVVRFGRPVKLGLVQVSYLKASRAWWLNGSLHGS